MRKFLLSLLCVATALLPARAQSNGMETAGRDSVTAIQTTPNPEIKNPYKFHATELIAPAILLGIGISGLESRGIKKLNREINDGLQKDGHKKVGIDNVSLFIPVAGAYVLNLCGVKGEHNLADMSIIYGTTYLLLAASLLPMKDFINSERPNGKNFNSFPSGHTAVAFAGAEVLRREYWKVSPWIGVAGYLFAAGTGFMRLYNNAHWLTDVVAGAGLGILCAEAAYWLYPAVARTFFRKQYDNNIFLTPHVSTRDVGVAFSMNF